MGGGESFTLGMAPLKDYSSNPAARQPARPASIAAGLACWLGDALKSHGKPLDLSHEDLQRGIKNYLDDNYAGIEKDAASGRKQIENERISRPYSAFEEAVQQVKLDVEGMKHKLDSGLERLLEFKDKIPKEKGEQR